MNEHKPLSQRGGMSEEACRIKTTRANELLRKKGLTIETWTQIFMNLEMTDWMLPLFYGMALKMEAPSIGEIGVRGGTSSVAFLLACRENNGRLYSVDIDPCEVARINISTFGLDQWWDFTQADSTTHDFPEPLDILFIDGEHTYEGVLADYERHSQNVKDGGVILFHDASHPDLPGCARAVKEAGATIIPYGHAGLGVLVK